MLQDEKVTEAFSEFVAHNEARLRHALMACLGADPGREAAADALAYGWEHWDRVKVMDNPVGYLFTVGRDRGRRSLRRPKVAFPALDVHQAPWVEPGLSAALSTLSERERIVVVLVNGYGWAMSEVATTLGISKGSVQTYVNRALVKLRRKLGVEN